jgi:ABC-2 type transport system permease protein
MADHAFPSTASLLLTQVRAQLRITARIPVAIFFTIALPLVMLVLFNALFGNDEIETPAGSWPISQFYVAGVSALTVVSGTFTNLVNMVPYRRQDGIMKRWRGTPLPRWTYLGGFVGSGVVIALAGLVLMVGLGVVAYGVQIEAAKVPGIVVTFVVGAASFSALGIAVAGLTRNPEAAPAVANAIVLPLSFVSDIFIPTTDAPPIVQLVGDVFPMKPFSLGLQAAFNPGVEAPGILWDRLAVVAAWGVAGVVLAARTFKWEPARDVASRRSSRRRGRRRPDDAPTGGSTGDTAGARAA